MDLLGLHGPTRSSWSWEPVPPAPGTFPFTISGIDDGIMLHIPSTTEETESRHVPMKKGKRQYNGKEGAVSNMFTFPPLSHGMRTNQAREISILHKQNVFVHCTKAITMAWY
jgi:squalene cyclase